MTTRILVLFLLLASAVAPAAAESPVTAARFSITVDGFEIASNASLGRLATETKGLQEFTDDTTSRGVVTFSMPQGASMEMWAWHEAAIRGDAAISRRSVEIVAYTRQGTPIARYRLTNAWPAKIAVTTLTSGGSPVMMETVTLVCEHIQRVAP